MYIRDRSLFLRERGWPGGNRGWAIWKNMVKTGAIRKNDDILRGVIKILKLLRVQRNLKLLSPTIYRLQILKFSHSAPTMVGALWKSPPQSLTNFSQNRHSQIVLPNFEKVAQNMSKSCSKISKSCSKSCSK